MVEINEEANRDLPASSAPIEAKPYLQSIKEQQLQALEQIHGIWKDDPKIDDALKQLKDGLDAWRKQLEQS